MEKRSIKCYTKGNLRLTFFEKSRGLEVELVDDQNFPIARYTFDIEKLEGIDSISYHSNNIRIHFDDITPASSSELCPVDE